MRSLKVPIVEMKRTGFGVPSGLILLLTVMGCLLPRLPGRAAEAVAQAPSARPPSSIRVDANPQLFATLCALYAAGHEADVSSAGSHPVRARIRGELLKQQGPATAAVRRYYREHLLADPAATLSRYISFALVAGPPPKFSYVLRHDELPPDVLAIEDFTDVLASFYREAQIERLWTQVAPEYDREIARLHAPVSQLVMSTSGYLRELIKPTSPRTFVVYVEPLVGAKTNFRNYGDHSAIVLSLGGELPRDEIRHALLHFLLDPLPGRYKPTVAAKKPLLDLAARAARLPAEHKEDFPAFLTECLVRAVELRMRRLPPEKLATAIDAAEGDGYVLVRAFVRELAKFEKAEPAMSFYFPDLLHGIETAAETKRLQGVQFAAALATEARAPEDAKPSAGAREASELDAWLTEGERQIASQNAAGAVAAFQRVLEKYPEQPRALYGLAVAAVLQGEAERAKELFHRLVARPVQRGAGTPAQDPLLLAWSHVYLGRIHDVDGNRELAVSEYRAALSVEGAPEAARQAAQRGIEKGYQPAPPRL